MKILYITLENLSLHKGSVVHIKEIINGLRKLGYKVGLIASTWGKFEESDDYYNLYRGFLSRLFKLKRQPYFISSIFLFLYLLKVIPLYHIIYARDYHTVMIALLPRLIFRKKLVFEINGLASEEQKLKGDSVLNSILVFLIKKTEKLATKYSDRIVAVTPQIASCLMTHFDCKPDKVEVVTNGVNTKKFHPIQDKGLLAEWRKRLGIAEEEMVVAFVGNLAPWQGVEWLIQVAPTLLRDFDNIRFLIIGDGILKDGLKASVNKLGISNNFIFTGMIDYKLIPLYINIADLCVLLKRRLASGFSPIKVYEYMACGKPIVASRVEGLEFIEVEGIGRLVESENITSIREALCDLLKDSEKRIERGLKGKQLACQRFDWESRVAQIGKILEELA